LRHGLNVFKAGFCRAGGSSGASRDLPRLLERGTVWDRNCIGNVLEEAMNCFAEMQRQTEEKFRMWIEKLTRLDTDEEGKQLEPREPKLHLAGQSFTPSSSSSTFVAAQDSPTLPQQGLGSYVSYQNVDSLEFPESALNNNNFPEAFPENDGPPVVTHYDISDTNSDPEVLSVDNMLAATVVKEHNSVSKPEPPPSWRTRGLLEELNADSGHLDPGLPSCDKLPPNESQNNEVEENIASSGSEVEIVGVQENARFVHPRGGVIQRVSSWKHAAGSQYNSSHQTPSWTGVTPQQNWTAPPEVVDLTLDEDSRRKYLL
ncbi:protein ARK2N, partial [Pyxicephalus adspersus]|uniref:protein ARK2N n=1 Tax=Pyxicephalus adspersus TaxID=30357 RepID=UPI003B5BE52D